MKDLAIYATVIKLDKLMQVWARMSRRVEHFNWTEIDWIADIM